jgi:hypothetical protein
MADPALEELLTSTEVQTARIRLQDYDEAEAAANRNPDGVQELAALRDALVEMPNAVRTLGRPQASLSTTTTANPAGSLRSRQLAGTARGRCVRRRDRPRFRGPSGWCAATPGSAP